MKRVIWVFTVLLGGMGMGLSLTAASALSFLAWVSLVPLFLGIRPRSSPEGIGTVRPAFATGALTGTGMSLVAWFWIPGSIASLSHGRWSLGIAVLGAITVFWAVTLGLFAVANTWIQRWISARVRSSATDCFLPWIAASLWILLEFALTVPVVALGFPFLPNLGNTQWNVPSLIQIASLTGVLGVSFLIVLINAALATAFRTRQWRTLLPALALLALVWIGGWLRIHAADRAPQETASPIRMAVLQGDIPPFPKFDRVQGNLLAQRYLDLARKASEARPNLVIWTESAVPWTLEEGDDLVETALKITQPAQACHLVGTLFRAPGGPTNAFHSTAFLILPDGQIVAQYHKMRLIAMVELPVNLPGVTHPVCALSGPTGERLVPGSSLSVLDSPLGRIGVTICNESLYSDMTRALVQRGADLLVAMSNDGWCRGNVSKRQHFAVSALRAVEAGRDIVVANNSGISGIVDAFGRVRDRTGINQATCFTGVTPGQHRSTFYSWYGDVFAAACLVLLALLPILVRLPGIRRQP